MEEKNYDQGYVAFNNGLITSIGDMQDITADRDDFDAGGGYVLPGFVDAHTCIGLKEESLRHEGVDWNESSAPITPQMNALDGFNPRDGAIVNALNGGVTTAVAIQGNMNLIGGQGIAIKLHGHIPAEMVIKMPCAIKFSLGEEPKTAYGGRGRSPVTRLAAAAMIREALMKARTYWEKGSSAIDYASEALAPLFKGEIPAYFHADRGDDIITALGICKEFGFDCVIVHGAESPTAAEQIKGANAKVIAGPLVLTNYSYETRNAGVQIPMELYEKSVSFCITTDHHASPIEYLSVSAALAVREGLPEDIALKSVTIEPARIAGIAHRVGSLAVGKDADILVFSQHPFYYASQIKVFANGEQIR